MGRKLLSTCRATPKINSLKKNYKRIKKSKQPCRITVAEFLIICQQNY